jgi:prepilin-type N-terminal cleavage/methylation domain-containing protein
MKTSPVNQRSGLTLVEMMVTMAIFSIVVIGFLYTHMFGLMQDQLTQSKLGASDQSRRSFGKMAEEIRATKIWSIGNGNSSGFTPIGNGNAQQGNAVKLCLTTNQSVYILYYFDNVNGILYRTHSPTNSGSDVIASNLTSTLYFRAEDYNGNLRTNKSHKAVIATRLQFQQYQYPLTMVGNGYYYDSYKMEFRLTPHVPDGQ